MQSLIKRNNFSPEDRKILNKIDRHIKELEEKVEQGGGNGDTGGGVEVYDINIELEKQYEKFFLGKETTTNKSYEPLPLMMMGEGSFPPNSFVNVLINGKKFYSGVAQQTYMEGMEAAVVAPLNLSNVISGSSTNYKITPTLIPVSVDGYGMIIMVILPHGSAAYIEGLTVISQDEINLKKAYNDAQSISYVDLNYRISTIQGSTTARTSFLYKGVLDGIKEFFSLDLQLSILVDSTGTITEVVSKDPIYNSLLDRIKALENGN